MTAPSQLEKGVRVRLLEDATERTVSKIASDIKLGLLASHFKASGKLLTGLHSDLVSGFKQIAVEEIKIFLEEDDCDMWKKLNRLDQIEENATAKPGHVAWRPSGNPNDTLRAIEGAELKKHLAMLKNLHAKLQADTRALMETVKEERETLIKEQKAEENFLNVLQSYIDKNRRLS